MSHVVVSVINLHKSYGDHEVLCSVNAEFVEGKIYGIVGRNGSGKSVLLKCITGLTKPTSGEVTVLGRSIDKKNDFPLSTGAMIEGPGVLGHLSAFANMKIVAAINRNTSEQAIRDLLARVGLDHKERKQVSKYSMGMKQRLGIAMALIDDPRVLVLDEPLTNIDANGVGEIRQTILQMKRSGRTIIIATHIQEDIEELCDVTYRMENGHLIQG